MSSEAVTATVGVRRNLVVGSVAVAGGVVLGALDLLGQASLPYPWANLANAPAVWAVAAFATGFWVRRGPVRCMLSAAALLVVAVEAYYLTAAVVLHDRADLAVSTIALVWSVFGVIAGLVFGLGGHLRAERGFWPAALGAALPVAVLLAEAIVLAGRRGYRWNDSTETALIEAALAVAVLVLAGRGARGRAATLALAAPLAVLGWAAFHVAGLAG